MSESPQHSTAADHDDPTAVTTVVVGAVSVILVLVSVIALEALYHRTVESESLRKSVEAGAYELRQIQVEQLQRISEYRILDAAEGKVSIPVERAMELLIEEHRATAAPITSADR